MAFKVGSSSTIFLDDLKGNLQVPDEVESIECPHWHAVLCGFGVIIGMCCAAIIAIERAI